MRVISSTRLATRAAHVPRSSGASVPDADGRDLVDAVCGGTPRERVPFVRAAVESPLPRFETLNCRGLPGRGAAAARLAVLALTRGCGDAGVRRLMLAFPAFQDELFHRGFAQELLELVRESASLGNLGQ
jgi:hypothetical protein